MVRETFCDKKARADREIGRDYLEAVVRHYAPLFDELKRIARPAMRAVEVEHLDLTPHALTFRNGKFFTRRTFIGLSELPAIYSDNDRRAAVEKGVKDKDYVAPNTHQAMQMAYEDFREKVRDVLSSRVD